MKPHPSKSTTGRKPFWDRYAEPPRKRYRRDAGAGEAGAEERPRPRAYPARPRPERAPQWRERPQPWSERPPRWRERPQPWAERPAPLRPAKPPTPPAKAVAAPDLDERLKRVKLFLCDVDGILTDAGVYMGQGEETKRFNIRDGFGLRLLQRQGVKVGWVSHRPSVATTKRAEDLKVDYLHQEPGSKVAAIESILAQAGLAWGDVCFMGDDIVDLGALKRAGLAATVSNGIAEAKALAHYITKASAGHGAVRELAELVLKAQDKWAPLVAEYSA